MSPQQQLTEATVTLQPCLNKGEMQGVCHNPPVTLRRPPEHYSRPLCVGPVGVRGPSELLTSNLTFTDRYIAQSNLLMRVQHFAHLTLTSE